MFKTVKLYHLLCVLVFLSSFLVYQKTLLPTVGFWDTAEFQTTPYTLDIAHPTGYPTFILLGKVFTFLPIKTVAYRLNLMSAFFTSMALTFIYATAVTLTSKPFISLSPVFFFAFSQVLWLNATHAEVHTLNLFFFSLLIFLVTHINKTKTLKTLPLLSFLFGLGIGNHLLLVLNVLAFLFATLFLFPKRKKGIKTYISTLFFFVLGISVYAFLPIRASQKSPLLTFDYDVSTWDGFARHVTAADFRHFMFTAATKDTAQKLSFYLNLLINQFQGWGTGLASLGFLYCLAKFPRWAIFFLLILLPNIAFSLNYQNAAIDRYFLTSFAVITILMVYGLTLIHSFLNSKFPKVSFLVLILPFFLPLYNLQLNFKKADQSQNFEGLKYAQSVFETVKSKAVIISWWSYSTPLWYLKYAEGNRLDIKIINADKRDWPIIIEKYIQKQPVYVIEPLKDLSKYQLQKTGPVYQVLELQ